MPSDSNVNHASPRDDRYVLAVKWHLRWQIYHRLTGLGVRCWCGPYQPLEVEISSPTAAIQLWSVVQQLTASPQQQSRWLRSCWHLSPRSVA